MSYNHDAYLESNTLANALTICNQDPECEYVLEHDCDHTMFQDNSSFGVLKVSDTQVQDNNGKLYSENRIWRVVTSSSVLSDDVSLYPATGWNDMAHSGTPYCVLKKPLDIGTNEKYPAASALDISNDQGSNDQGDGMYWIKPYFSTKAEEVYVKWSSSEFHLSDEAYTWSEAATYCENRGSTLASVHSQEEWEKILSISKDTADCDADNRCGNSAHSTCMWFWLGGYVNSANNWAWNDGSAWDWQPSSPVSNQPAANSEGVWWANGSPYLSGWGIGVSTCYGGIGLSWHDYVDASKQQAVCRESNRIQASSNDPWVRVQYVNGKKRKKKEEILVVSHSYTHTHTYIHTLSLSLSLQHQITHSLHSDTQNRITIETLHGKVRG